MTMAAASASATNGNGDLGAAGTATGTKPKLHGRAFYESIGSPRFVVAPMVDQSEFAWRMLTRSFLTPSENAKTLAYTPMFHARLFRENGNHYRDTHFQVKRSLAAAGAGASPSRSDAATMTEATPFLDGNPAFDRPLFVQFCANDPDHLLAAAQLAAPYCDAIDLNLGCPQGIAKKGGYGAFLQENTQLVYDLINCLHRNLPIPVTAKVRILDTKEATLAYARTVLDAGASIITVHGRRREQKGHLTGLADWSYIRFLRESLPPETVIFANGNVLRHGDLEACLEATGADAVMTAEGNLSDPAIFARAPAVGDEGREYWRGRDGKGGWRVDAVFRRYMDIIHKHVLQHDPPSRRPLFVVGDDESWLHEAAATKEAEGATEAEEGPARKKQKKNKDNDKDGGNGRGKHEKCFDPNLVAMRAHLFHLLRHLISRHTDIRDALARCHAGDVAAVERVLEMVERRVAAGLVEYERTDGRSAAAEMEEAEAKMRAAAAKAAAAAEEAAGKDGSNGADADAAADEEEEADDPESSVATVRACRRPWWVSQPIVRPLPKEALAKGALSLSKKERKRMAKEKEAAAAAAKEKERGRENGGTITSQPNEKEKEIKNEENKVEGNKVEGKKDKVEGNKVEGKKDKVEDELPRVDGKDGIRDPVSVMQDDKRNGGAVAEEMVCG